MKRTLIEELYLNKGKEVKIQGWIHRLRKLGKIAFIMLRDRTGIVQCVLDCKAIDIKGLKQESVVEVIGLIKDKQGADEEVEIEVRALNVISNVKEDLPIEINKSELECNLDTILNNRVLSLRNIKTNSIFKIQAELAHSFQEFLINEGFTQVFSPKIVAEGTEGGTELFPLQYFEKKAYLAQSPQFYKQMLVGAGYERVFEVAHVYRAEEHNTQRHLNEYVSLDLELGFIEDERDIMALEEKLLKFMLNRVSEKCSKELNLLEAKLPEYVDNIPSLRLEEAVEILKTKYNRTELVNDLDPEGERQICEYAKEYLNSEFLFLTHYPRSKRPMYAMPAEEKLTHSFDLLFRGLEITTGGQRIHNYEQLVESISSKGLNPESFNDYLQVFKYGMPPHGGLAIGLERLTAQLLGIKNIRETCLFPRDRERLTP
ncbi:aspartate--tRNA(Asn) ligase [Clostridium omnivorum]|uniref:Aspartate--tRNA ligase n=1 Tax=Clostridium omnivorum TaxID=1604902 RepID=A0ABQ5N2I6_9CLOT|nr:aspartate--tRNA(Asn) ligase [Clostridium sp. E14]GLC29413.1 aspartate--tRNA(Asn) ligase [Clostridium sp. E14]